MRVAVALLLLSFMVSCRPYDRAIKDAYAGEKENFSAMVNSDLDYREDVMSVMDDLLQRMNK